MGIDGTGATQLGHPFLLREDGFLGGSHYFVVAGVKPGRSLRATLNACGRIGIEGNGARDQELRHLKCGIGRNGDDQLLIVADSHRNNSKASQSVDVDVEFDCCYLAIH